LCNVGCTRTLEGLDVFGMVYINLIEGIIDVLCHRIRLNDQNNLIVIYMLLLISFIYIIYMSGTIIRGTLKTPNLSW
jgi:hypothetical protein